MARVTSAQWSWIDSQLKSLELQIRVLKAHLPKEKNSKAFGSLYGLLQGESESTWEEIQAVKYKSKDLP